MTFTYKIGISAQEHDQFVQNSGQTNLLQSSKWAHIKDNWDNERIGFYEDGKMVASASILIKRLPLGFTMFYIPRGPILDYQNPELVNYVMYSLKQYGRKRRAVFIKFDPALLLRQYQITDSSKELPEDQESLTAIKNLQKSSCLWSGRTIQISDSIQPRFQANIYTQAEQESSFPKHTKLLMKDASNLVVKTYRGSI